VGGRSPIHMQWNPSIHPSISGSTALCLAVASSSVS
jgi:hypothetical protein